MSGNVQRLSAEVERLRKILIDSWGDVPGERLYTADSKEMSDGDT
jgi:hypothetical protein